MVPQEKEKRELIEKLMNNNEENPQSQVAYYKNLIKREWQKLFVIVFLVMLIVINIYYYNLFVVIKQQVQVTRSDVETAVQLRENMIPAILTTITNLMNHENEIFIHAADVRARSIENKSASPGSKSISPGEPVPAVSEPVPAENWDKLLLEMFAIAEAYPDIKTGEPFQYLMSKIADAEIEIQTKRVEYNASVRDFNVFVNSFPAALFAYVFRIKPELYFQWTSKPEWVSTLDEETRRRTDEVLEKWRSKVMDE